MCIYMAITYNGSLAYVLRNLAENYVWFTRLVILRENTSGSRDYVLHPAQALRHIYDIWICVVFIGGWSVATLRAADACRCLPSSCW